MAQSSSICETVPASRNIFMCATDVIEPVKVPSNYLRFKAQYRVLTNHVCDAVHSSGFTACECTNVQCAKKCQKDESDVLELSLKMSCIAKTRKETRLLPSCGCCLNDDISGD